MFVSNAFSQKEDFKIVNNKNGEINIEFQLDGKTIIKTPKDGVWSVSYAWENDWMKKWEHSSANKIEKINDRTILSGEMNINNGVMLLSDSYKKESNGLIHVIRRFQWNGKDTLKNAVLSVRLSMDGKNLKPYMPGILFYGNPAGAKVNDKIIPVYKAQKGDFAIFEDHRFSMPFTMLENAKNLNAAAIHTVPSPVRGAKLNDQWWSLGIENYGNYTEFVLYSGPIGYNHQRSVAKALQTKPMKYTDTYINMEPGRVIEKEFYIELYNIEKEGTGFQRPVYTSIEMHKPFDADRFSSFKEIVSSKYEFAKTRWIDNGKDFGFGMYPLSSHKDIVMGWCGQADSPGYFLQKIGKYINDDSISIKIQNLMDYLSDYPIMENGMFNVGYSLSDNKFYGGDPVSCGQAMYNFAKAIEYAKKNKKLDTSKWEVFLKKCCDAQSKRILEKDWTPISTAEAFLIAPLAISAKLFKNDTYKKAALKAGDTFVKRHLSMKEPYWGGTLDATCEDKEGAWAAFQGFLEIYERFGNKKYLSYAKHAMDVCLSYVVVWDIPLPAGRLADHNFKTTGWTVVSAQNQHIDVYGVLFAPEIYKMGRYLKNESLKKISKVMYRSCFQLTDSKGSQGEQLQQTNFAQHGDMSNVHNLRGGYSENWTVFWITAHFLNAAAKFQEIGIEP
ncbi:MAG: hypothetical protein Q4F97_00800 [Bacteroidales bacterium]|nr:hypothetical protein [Bacteroidales bacterium]